MSDVANAGYDDFLDAVESGDAFYLACPDGHGSLPPRRVCPTCGATGLERTPLPETATVETVTVTHVPTPSFEDDAPYATVIADFDPVRITGLVAGDILDELELGLSVTLDVDVTETTGDRVLVFRPVGSS